MLCIRIRFLLTQTALHWGLLFGCGFDLLTCACARISYLQSCACRRLFSADVARFHNDALSELARNSAAVGCVVCVRSSGCVLLCGAFCGAFCAGLSGGKFHFRVEPNLIWGVYAACGRYKSLKRAASCSQKSLLAPPRRVC
jgi:hypothetical protein